MLPKLEQFTNLRKLSIRLYEDRDFDAVYETIRQIGEGVLGKGLRAWDEAFSAPNGLLWTAEIGGVPIGFAGSQEYGNGVMVFHSDLVNPDHQRNGVGSALVLARLATTDANAIDELGILATEFSRPFYERFGFCVEQEPVTDPFTKVTIYQMARSFHQALSDEAWSLLSGCRVNLVIAD